MINILSLVVALWGSHGVSHSSFVSPFTGCPKPTAGSAVVIVPASPAISTPAGLAGPGDAVALFSDAGKCLGSAALTGEAVAIVLWSDDPYTPSVDGFSEGEVPEFRVYDASSDVIYSSGVAATYESGLAPTSGLESGAVYALSGAEEPEETSDPAWISEVGVASGTPFVEVTRVGDDLAWLAGIDDTGVVRWTVDLTAVTAAPGGFLTVTPDDLPSDASLLPDGQAGAVALLSAAAEIGQSADDLALRDAVVLGAPEVARDGDLLLSLGQTVQYALHGPLSRVAPAGLFFPTPPTPDASNAAPTIPDGPDMAFPPGSRHLLSFPMVLGSGDDVTLADLAALGPLVGIPGSDSPSADPNIWTEFDQSGAWSAPASMDVALPPGRGVAWTWPSGSSAASGPTRIQLSGLPIDNTATGGLHTVLFDAPSPTGQYPVGNPYLYPLRLDGLSVGSGTLQSSVAVWDAEASTYIDLFLDADQGYHNAIPVWAGAIAEVTGDISGALAFSFSSAQVDPLAEPLDAQARPTGLLSFALVGTLNNGQSVEDRSAHVRYVEGAQTNWDIHDASKLTPPVETHSLVALVGQRDGQVRRQRVLSLPPGPLSPTVLSFTSTIGGAFELQWSGDGDLEDLELLDRTTGTVTNLGESSSYAFNSSRSLSWSNRFELRQATRSTLSAPGPESVSVGTPFPNPATTSATVRVTTARPGDVSADVFDLVGRRVAAAGVRTVSASSAEVHADVRDLATGLYVLVVRVGASTSTQRFSVIR